MNFGQEKLLSFIIERVYEPHKDTAKEMLLELFQKQKAGELTRNDVAHLQEKLVTLLKTEAVNEVKMAISKFTLFMK